MLKDYLKGKFSLMPNEKRDPAEAERLQKEINMANENLAEANRRKDSRVYQIEPEEIEDVAAVEEDYNVSLKSLEHTVGAVETLSEQLVSGEREQLNVSLYNANRSEALGQIEEIKTHFKKGTFPLLDEKLEEMILRMEKSFIDTGSWEKRAA